MSSESIADPVTPAANLPAPPLRPGRLLAQAQGHARSRPPRSSALPPPPRGTPRSHAAVASSTLARLRRAPPPASRARAPANTAGPAPATSGRLRPSARSCGDSRLRRASERDLVRHRSCPKLPEARGRGDKRQRARSRRADGFWAFASRIMVSDDLSTACQRILGRGKGSAQDTTQIACS